ncbi:hypothetical protein [Gracilibacillus sp. YIM 98692]|uniref:hypothetical protein n=1 Tax=Gracilibacillus sp. YIM 98692 TaxID=2663532 RepID=UPI001F089FA2|nr:hypothetical protein [Gracilibacillus sp. YIM 98692]
MSTADNIVGNSSFEREEDADNWPDHWSKVTESGESATYEWVDAGMFGSKAVKISDTTGWATVASKKVSYDRSTHVASAYVKTSAADSKSFIKVEYYDSQGSFLDQKFSYGITGTHDWTRLHLVADNAPTGTAEILVKVGVNAADTGSTYFDGIQLEKGTVVSAYNLVENSSFERDSDGNDIPDNWTTSGNLSTNDEIDTTEVYVGNNSFKLTGESQKDKFIKQHIDISGDSTTKLTLSGWSKQSDADPNGGNYLLQVAINNSDGTTDWSNAHDFSKTKSG